MVLPLLGMGEEVEEGEGIKTLNLSYLWAGTWDMFRLDDSESVTSCSIFLTRAEIRFSAPTL